MEIQNIVTIFCIIGMVYCIMKYIFNCMPYHIIKLESLGNDCQEVTIKRLWKTYRYVTGDDIHIHDIDNNIDIDRYMDKQ